MLLRVVTAVATFAALLRMLRMRAGYRRIGQLNLALAEEALPAENEVGAPRIGG